MSLALPLVALYEGSILSVRFVERRAAAARATEAAQAKPAVVNACVVAVVLDPIVQPPLGPAPWACHVQRASEGQTARGTSAASFEAQPLARTSG